jgi:hypothetical protein
LDIVDANWLMINLCNLPQQAHDIIVRCHTIGCENLCSNDNRCVIELWKQGIHCVLMKYMKLIWSCTFSNDTVVDVQCTKQRDFSAWSDNLDHMKIMRQCTINITNTFKASTCVSFRIVQVNSITWFFCSQKMTLMRWTIFVLGMYGKSQVFSWFETLEWTPTFEFTKVSFKQFVVIINLDIDWMSFARAKQKNLTIYIWTNNFHEYVFISTHILIGRNFVKLISVVCNI